MSGTRFAQALGEWVDARQQLTTAAAFGLALLIAIVDWFAGSNITLGPLYTLPILIGGFVMSRGGVVAFAVACSVLREAFGPFQWQPAYPVRLAVVGAAFSGAGLLVSEMHRNRKLIVENLRQRERNLLERREWERQLTTLVETSPLPILVATSEGTIVIANEASRVLLALPFDLSESNFYEYLPELKNALPQVRGEGTGYFRREIECAGRKQSGESFYAHVWLTAYESSGEERMAVVLWDASEDLQGRELAAVESRMAASRILLAGFAHEVRNVVAASSAVIARLSARYRLEIDEEYQALAGALRGLSDLAASGLRLGAENRDRVVDLGASLEQIRVILQPVLDDAGVRVLWNVPERLPRVHADHSVLIQVFLNLAGNSERATRGISDRLFRVQAECVLDSVTITVCDNGPGVADPEHLFEAFRSGGDGAGLGLYVSRASLRSSGGDLWYEPNRGGACFCIRLHAAMAG